MEENHSVAGPAAGVAPLDATARPTTGLQDEQGPTRVLDLGHGGARRDTGEKAPPEAGAAAKPATRLEEDPTELERLMIEFFGSDP